MNMNNRSIPRFGSLGTPRDTASWLESEWLMDFVSYSEGKFKLIICS